MYVRVDIRHVLCEQWLDATLSVRPVETTTRRASGTCPFGALLQLNGALLSVSI